MGGINWVQSVREDPDVAKLVEKGKKQFAGSEIAGKKIGVIGLGASAYLLPMPATVSAWKYTAMTPFISVDAAWNLPEIFIILTVWTIFTASAIILRSMCRCWILHER